MPFDVFSPVAKEYSKQRNKKSIQHKLVSNHEFIKISYLVFIYVFTNWTRKIVSKRGLKEAESMLQRIFPKKRCGMKNVLTMS
jgi:hypothetical protein